MQPRSLAFLAHRSIAFGALTTAALLAACAKPVAPVAEAPPPLPPHQGSPAAVCTVAPFHVADGGTATVSMVISNDGGYCTAPLTAGNGQPYDAALVHIKPLHGEDMIQRYNGRTSIEYSAKPGYVGRDSFPVQLILKGQAGYTTLNVTVDVQPAGAVAKTS